tara:strand:- start:1093 stop:1548 length:456 start_codon:yes stop_codon:yes gene_type:complete
MSATVTLATTTLTAGIGPLDREISLGSNSGVLAGLFLFIDQELMRVDSILGNGILRVARGLDGTAAQKHSSSAVVTIGSGTQFYSTDPVGSPAEVTDVAPWINTKNGKVWYAQGDALPTGFTYRWWQDATTSYSTGPLGIRVFSTDLSSST